MTKEYSLKKKTNYWLNPWLISSILFFIVSLASYYFLSQKPELDLQQVDLSSWQLSEQILADSFDIIILSNNNNQITIKQKLIKENQYVQILNAISNNMDWPEALEYENSFRLEQNHKKTLVINFNLDRTKLTNISIAKERDILSSISESLKLHGIDDYKILINGQESKVFLKNISLLVGSD